MNEGDGPEISRRERICDERIAAVRIGGARKNTGVTDIDAALPAKLRAEADRVEQRPGEGLVGEVGLVEDVVAIGLVLVGRKVECGLGGIDGTCQGAVPRIY